MSTFPYWTAVCFTISFFVVSMGIWIYHITRSMLSALSIRLRHNGNVGQGDIRVVIVLSEVIMDKGPCCDKAYNQGNKNFLFHNNLFFSLKDFLFPFSLLVQSQVEITLLFSLSKPHVDLQ
jgi:hypothetical protein